MKWLKTLCINPIAIAVTVVHWIVVTYAIYGEQHSQPFHWIYEPLLTQYLYFINLLPILFVGIVFSPLLDLFSGTSFLINILLLLNFIAISFQWLLIGNAVSKIIDFFRKEEPKFSLRNE